MNVPASISICNLDSSVSVANRAAESGGRSLKDLEGEWDSPGKGFSPWSVMPLESSAACWSGRA